MTEVHEASLEATLKELERIATELESGDQPLEKALELFENGIRLARAGQKRIADAEARIEVLLAAGTADESLEPFDATTGARGQSQRA